MSDQSQTANGSVTSGSFLLVLRSRERRTVSTQDGRRAQLGRSLLARAGRGPDGAIRPSALRAGDVYAVTRGQSAIGENI
jgi:hypothetical protein